MRATGRLVTIVCPLLLLPAGFAAAGQAGVVSASARCDAASLCEITATLQHDDEGWRHYADRWEVLDPAAQHVAIFAHNPALTEVANLLSDAEIPNVPPCGLVRIRLNVERWTDVTGHCGALEGIDLTDKERGR